MTRMILDPDKCRANMAAFPAKVEYASDGEVRLYVVTTYALPDAFVRFLVTVRRAPYKGPEVSVYEGADFDTACEFFNRNARTS